MEKPRNSNSVVAVAVLLAACVAAPGCGNKKSELPEECGPTISDLQKKVQEQTKATKTASDCCNEQGQNLARCEGEVEKYKDEAQAREQAAKAQAEKARFNEGIAAALREEFGSGLETLILREIAEKALQNLSDPEAKDKYHFINRLISIFENANGLLQRRVQLLQTVGKDAKKIHGLADKLVRVMRKLPIERQLKLNENIRPLLAAFDEAYELYTKFKEIIDHQPHQYWEAKDDDEFDDPCNNKPLHVEYNNLDSAVRMCLRALRALETQGIPPKEVKGAVDRVKRGFGYSVE